MKKNNKVNLSVFIKVLIIPFFLAMTLIGCGGGGDGVSEDGNQDNKTSAAVASQLLVSEVHLNAEDGTLTIYGQNLDTDELGDVEAFLDGAPLNIIQKSANKLVVTLPDGLDLNGTYLITVRMGSDNENFDAYVLVLGITDPSGLFNQLTIEAVETMGEPGQEIFNIRGYNFDNGEWPSEVVFNGIPLLVDVDQSNPELLVVHLNEEALEALHNPTGKFLITVRTGTDVANNDVYGLIEGDVFDEPSPPVLGNPSDTAPEQLVCRNQGRAKIPLGEYCCETVTGQDLCWKSGPEKPLTTKDVAPYYFELTKDYDIPLTPYFANPPPVEFPSGGYGKDSKWIRDRIYLSVIGLAQCDANAEFVTKSRNRKWGFIRVLPDGTLQLKKGYRWDGASRGIDRKESKKKDDWLYATLRVDMRAALVHDAIYDLLRLRYIPCRGFRTRENYRGLADVFFYLFAKEDGHWRTGDGNGIGGLRGEFDILRIFGKKKTDNHIEYESAWRFHTLADASVSVNGGEMLPGEDGSKTLTLSCAADGTEIELDAGTSRPIAIRPMRGAYQADLHETRWEWTLNTQNLVPENNHLAWEDWNTEPDKFRTVLTVDDLINSGLTPGIDSTLKLIIDKGKDTDMGYFKSTDEIRINIDFDTEPPVITGVTDTIIAWPPNHKYMTFTIADFVTEVFDNCSVLSLDELVITQVTSDEPDDDKGDGHTEDDIVIAPDGKSVKLRVERSGHHDGRIYTVYVQAVDERGNTTTEPFQVQIPHHHEKCPDGEKT